MEMVKLSYQYDLSDFMTSYSYSGELLKGSGKLLSIQQYNLRVGEGKGKVEGVGRKGMGSEWSLQTCQLHNYYLQRIQ